MSTTISSLEVVPKILQSRSTSKLLEIAEKTHHRRVTDFDAESEFSIYSLTPQLLQKLTEVTDIITELVQHNWVELPDEVRELLRSLFSKMSSGVKKESNIFTNIKAGIEFTWIRIRCGTQNLNTFIKSVEKLKAVLSEAIQFENSAEARAIERLRNKDEFTEWITVVEKGENINIEELKDWLAERGYSTEIQLPGDQTPQS